MKTKQTAKQTAKQLLKEINSYSVETRCACHEVLFHVTCEKLRSNASMLNRLEYQMVNDMEQVNNLMEWAREFQ